MTPRAPRTFVVFGFASTHDALAAEAAMHAADVDVTPIPTPRDLGAGCGIALRVLPEDEDRAARATVEAGVTHSGTTVVQDL
jgi:hypothetical protein